MIIYYGTQQIKRNKINQKLVCSIFLFLFLGQTAHTKPTKDFLHVATLNGNEFYEFYKFSPTKTTKINLSQNHFTPMGSLWKLFVYVYLIGTNRHLHKFSCKGKSIQETFCCTKGGYIKADQALYRSCGLFFKPNRLGISSLQWNTFWKQKNSLSYSWLINLKKIEPNTNIPVRELLVTLQKISKNKIIFGKVQSTLAKVFTQGTAKGAFRHLGLMLRVKTFTWDDPKDYRKFVGGFAGWLPNGNAVWVLGQGSSRMVLKKWGKQLKTLFDKKLVNPSKECVHVRFLSRYPIQEVYTLPHRKKAKEGRLYGKYLLYLKNGKKVFFQSNYDILYEVVRNKKRLTGIFNLNDYIARVLEREVKLKPAEATKAFAITIRTYLLQNAKKYGDCYFISDSTRYQRVSLNPPRKQAKIFSYWTDSIVLKGGGSVHYHLSHPKKNVLSWIYAKKMAEEGMYYDQILKVAFPQSKIGVMDLRRNQSCERLLKAESWLRVQRYRWKKDLVQLSGYVQPQNIEVCKMRSGNPFMDFRQNRIYASPLYNLDAKIALVHEYLHLAFMNHPRTMDEFFIEKIARKLVLKKGGYGRF